MVSLDEPKKGSLECKNSESTLVGGSAEKSSKRTQSHKVTE